MAAAGGAASIITQVSQGAPAGINTLSGKRRNRTSTRTVRLTAAIGVGSDESVTLDLRYVGTVLALLCI